MNLFLNSNILNDFYKNKREKYSKFSKCSEISCHFYLKLFKIINNIFQCCILLLENGSNFEEDFLETKSIIYNFFITNSSIVEKVFKELLFKSEIKSYLSKSEILENKKNRNIDFFYSRSSLTPKVIQTIKNKIIIKKTSHNILTLENSLQNIHEKFLPQINLIRIESLWKYFIENEFSFDNELELQLVSVYLFQNCLKIINIFILNNENIFQERTNIYLKFFYISCGSVELKPKILNRLNSISISACRLI